MADKREEIVSIATKAIQRDGLRSVSFRKLANEAGIKSSSVLYHFPTKPDLAESLVLNYTEQFEERLSVIDRGERCLVAKLEALVEIFEGVLSRAISVGENFLVGFGGRHPHRSCGRWWSPA